MIKYFVIVLAIAGFAFYPSMMPESFAQCIANEDWSQAPCLDMIVNECHVSEDVKNWMNYHDHKGESIMESKRIEMANASDENRLQEWKSESHENSNVWQYYYLKGETSDISGAYYSCTEQTDADKSFSTDEPKCFLRWL